ncbi:topoisomerase II-associated protein isoform X2 [Wolffia australiana]
MERLGLPGESPGDNRRNYPGSSRFDASQYDFFGKDIVEEVELGGLDDEEEEDVVFLGTEGVDNRYSSLGNGDEVRELRSLSSVDHLTRKLSKLNHDGSDLGSMGTISDRGFLSGASWSQDVDLKNFGEPEALLPLDEERVQENRHWPQGPFSVEPMYRASSFPDLPQPQFHLHSHPLAVPSPQSFPFAPFPSPSPPNLSPPLTHSHHPPLLSRRGRPPTYGSRYMTAEEIDGIQRIQHAATHPGDPYVDDYYHQACLAARSMHHFFCPSSVRELPPLARPTAEPHAFLQVDALGRVPFSSIRRPRPLLELEASASPPATTRPLAEEPLLAARIAIEDGFCLLLDVDDIHRLLQFNRPPDGGAQLRWRRQALLQALASSLQPGLLPIGSLPKGRKLLCSFLQRLEPNSELAGAICANIFYHLRVLEPLDRLARAVASCTGGLNLGSLGGCLVSIAQSREPPPLQPGGGAVLAVKAVLERATELLTNPAVAASLSGSERARWQASFDAFFGVLTRYCIGQFERIVAATQGKMDEAARAVAREMPVELLRASLPHTDEHQRKMLLEFAQRSASRASAAPDSHSTTAGAGPFASPSIIG